MARRRWVKCCSAVRATLKIARIREEAVDKGQIHEETRDPSYLSSDRELWCVFKNLIFSFCVLFQVTKQHVDQWNLWKMENCLPVNLRMDIVALCN